MLFTAIKKDFSRLIKQMENARITEEEVKFSVNMLAAYGIIMFPPLCALLVFLKYLCFDTINLAFMCLALYGMGSRRPSHESLLFLLLCFLCVAVSFLNIGLPYFFSVFAIIYVGAVSTLFLFVIMLLGRQLVNDIPCEPVSNLRASLFGFGVVAYLHFFMLPVSWLSHLFVEDTRLDQSVDFTSSKDLAISIRSFYSDISIVTSLYTTHGVLFLVATWMIFSAFFGAVIIALSISEKPKTV